MKSDAIRYQVNSEAEMMKTSKQKKGFDVGTYVLLANLSVKMKVARVFKNLNFVNIFITITIEVNIDQFVFLLVETCSATFLSSDGEEAGIQNKQPTTQEVHHVHLFRVNANRFELTRIPMST